MVDEATGGITIVEAYARAVEHFNAARFREADMLCTAILQADPRNIDVINLLGVIAQRLNRHDLAVGQFQRAIAIDGASPMLHCNLGNALSALGRLEEAEAA